MEHKKSFDAYVAGLDALRNRRRDPLIPTLGPFTPTICIGDLHSPWTSTDALSLVYLLIEKIKPKRVIQMGDSMDLFSYSKFSKSSNIIMPKDEVRMARELVESMWCTIRKIVPKAELLQIAGNHDVRPLKLLIDKCPELEPFVGFDTIFKYDGVKTIWDPRETPEFDGVFFTHGHLLHGRHRGKPGMQGHVVHGHDHKLSLTYNNVNGRLLFEMGCGYLGDPSASCFNYTTKKETGWNLGIGYISELGPLVIPFD